LTPWERKGGNGAIINIPNDQLDNNFQVVEIKPGGKSEPEHHLYEETVYVISGRGATTIWVDKKQKQTSNGKREASFPSRSIPGPSTLTVAVTNRCVTWP
jgi:hypothetical protein